MAFSARAAAPVNGDSSIAAAATTFVNSSVAAAPAPSAPADAVASAFGAVGESVDGRCLCATRSDGRGGCADPNDARCTNPACQTDDDCDPGRFCMHDSCCPDKPSLCVGICPDGPACDNPGTCRNGFEECRQSRSTCRYLEQKVKAKGGCQACGEPQPCGLDSGVACDDVGSCRTKIVVRQNCPDGRPGFCKIKRKRCDCA
ncbi:MAG: hypothetical protein C4547_00910 [Phycisphaerales bacterium]|nr:MAG: hypothetical protein C4547_00910 [Phycisphaerales bacterium]